VGSYRLVLLSDWWYDLPDEGPHQVRTTETASLHHGVLQCSDSPDLPSCFSCTHATPALPFFQLHPLTAFQIDFSRISTPSMHHSAPVRRGETHTATAHRGTVTPLPAHSDLYQSHLHTIGELALQLQHVT